ncbi:MAG: hypothetical protein HRU40_20185 [Saprospiraceae bacterium]|nr:hypothetical protein [Saprospiraceae bacterium]
MAIYLSINRTYQSQGIKVSMKGGTWNPTRRNRNIGTKKSGYSQNNKLTIPSKWCDYRVFWERLTKPVACPIEIKGHQITLLVEPPKDGYIHASTPQDIIRVLNLIPQEHIEEIELVVLRQPKKKEEILKPVWGRFVYYADIGKYHGAGVYIESMKAETTLKWGNRIDPYERKELQALESEGHKITKVKKGYDIRTSAESIRNTQLFRTLPHEIGHAIDYLKNSLEPSINATTEAESDYISDKYSSKPSHDKEEFAHRYAREFYAKMSSQGHLPFSKILNKEKLIEMNLSPEWFGY